MMSIGLVEAFKWPALVRSASSVTMNDHLHTYSGYRVLAQDALLRGAVEIRGVVLRLNHAWNMIALWSIQTHAVSNDFISDALQKVNWFSCLPENVQTTHCPILVGDQLEV